MKIRRQIGKAASMRKPLGELAVNSVLQGKLAARDHQGLDSVATFATSLYIIIERAGKTIQGFLIDIWSWCCYFNEMFGQPFMGKKGYDRLKQYSGENVLELSKSLPVLR